MDVSEAQVDGETVLHLACAGWRGEVVLSRGANLWRLRHASGLELLRTPPSVEVFRDKTEMWGMPVLLLPNRLAGGRFSWNGRAYRLPINDSLGRHHIHGLVSRVPWRLASVGDDTVTLRFDHDGTAASYAWFPHAFTVDLTYRFRADEVVQEASVVNTGADAMPFGFGFHTAFRLPFGGGGAAEAERCRVRVTAGDWQWEMSPEDLIPTGRRLPFPAESWNDGILTETQPVFAHVPVASRDGFRGAVLESPADNVRITYEVDKQFRYWVLWNYGGGQNFFCPEPQTWMVDAPNQTCDPACSGMQALAPGQRWSATNRICCQTLHI